MTITRNGKKYTEAKIDMMDVLKEGTLYDIEAGKVVDLSREEER